MKDARSRWILTLLVLIVVGRLVLAQTTARETPLYAPMTFPIDIESSLYTNPFDADDIELVGVFESPSGRQLIIPGFWMQPYSDECQEPCRVESLQTDGDPTWQVRFAPDETGHWAYNLQVRDDGTTVRVENGEFDVVPSDRPGFIGVSGNKRYFQYGSGQSYFPIGHNLLWSWSAGGGLVAYDKWLRELSEAGGNYARLLIDDPWFIGLEWSNPAGDYRAAQDDAARLDTILVMAEKYGVSLQIVVLWHQALTTYQGVPVVILNNPARPDTSADWDNYGYNARNGGPLASPGAFFADERAQALFRQRLRYIAGRWGYSPQVFAWEMIDEIDRTTNYNPTVASAWLQMMAGYLREVDQNRHLITAGSRDNDTTIADNPALSFTQARFFQRRPFETTADQVVGALDPIRQNLRLADEPTLLTEFSLNPWLEPTADDSDGISVQTTLWAAAFSGAGGGAASAYGETYVAPLGLQRYYPPLAAFAATVDWARLDLQPAEAALVSDDGSLYKPLRVSDFLRRRGEGEDMPMLHAITPDGVLPDVSNLSSYLFGQLYNRDLHRTQHYSVVVPYDTYFEARIRATSTQTGAQLAISVDGKLAAELVLDPGSNDVALRVPLSVGSHEVTLENVGDDWLELDYLEIGQLVAPVRMLTLRDSTAGVALSWLQNRDYTWDRIANERAPLLFTYRVDQLPPGKYAVDIWDPLSGAVVGSELTSVGDDGILSVDLVPMSDELAVRAERQPDKPPPTLTPTDTPTPLVIATNTPLPTLPPTSTNTPVDTDTPTATDTPVTTDTPTATATFTPTSSPTREDTATSTATRTPTRRPTQTSSITATVTPRS
ncbi:MAG: DUF5060 domain-containing protein [Anaerolineae bacterium]